MSYVNVVFGRRVLFLLIVFTANLKANSSAPIGPDSTHSKMPPGRGTKEKEQKKPTSKQKGHKIASLTIHLGKIHQPKVFNSINLIQSNS